MAPEVSIYLQKVKTYILENDDIRRKHFFPDGEEERFFEMVEKISEQNFKEKNEPELTIEQFEEIRKTLQKVVPLFGITRIVDNHYGFYSLN